MDAPVIAGLITALAIVVSPIVAFMYTKFHEERNLQPLAADRKKALTGHWRGKSVQPSMTSDMDVRLEVARKKVKGLAELRFQFDGQERRVSLKLDGGFLHDRFLKLDYAKKESDGAIQFGALVVELSEDARSLRGKYAGYGSMTRDIVSGTIELEKVS